MCFGKRTERRKARVFPVQIRPVHLLVERGQVLLERRYRAQHRRHDVHVGEIDGRSCFYGYAALPDRQLRPQPLRAVFKQPQDNLSV